jgi:hypothetical protein
MAPDEMHQQFGEYSAVEIARYVGDLRTDAITTSPSRSWHVGRMPRRAISGLMSWLTSRLHSHTAPGTVEPVKPHAIPFSH